MTTHDDLVKRLRSNDIGWEGAFLAMLDAADAIEQLQRDLAILMADKEEEVRLHREACERAASLMEPTDEMIRAALAITHPALYSSGLYSEHDGPMLRAETEARIRIMRKQYLAMVNAALAQREGL